jgi:hypothetical protein
MAGSAIGSKHPAANKEALKKGYNIELQRCDSSDKD